MARTFDGVDDAIQCGIGALTGQTAGNLTFAAVIRRAADSEWKTVVSLNTTSSNQLLGLQVSSSNNAYFFNSLGNEADSAFTITTAEGWVLLAATKAAGTAAVRFHKYVFSTRAWTHENAESMADGSSPGPSGNIKVGAKHTGADFWNGEVTAVGVFAAALSDAQLETLPFGLAAWHALSPKALLLLDQAATSQAVVDITGNGSNQTALTGTTVSTLSVPTFNRHGWILEAAREPGAAVQPTSLPAMQRVHRLRPLLIR